MKRFRQVQAQRALGFEIRISDAVASAPGGGLQFGRGGAKRVCLVRGVPPAGAPGLVGDTP